MATLQQIAAGRKKDLKKLKELSLKVDASQEKLEREILRVINRKKNVPEASDALRISGLIAGTYSDLNSLSDHMTVLAEQWRSL